ncbi:MAG: DUF4255 domain-containing protein [Mastigocoleus sp.]
MSNYEAVATVTAVLQRILQSAVQADIDGVRVTTIQPRNIGNGTPEIGINLFLYHVVRNAALNNMDTTPFRSKGLSLKRQAALDLYYMISFYGNDIELEPQRLLGSVVRTFNDYPSIKPEAIAQVTADTNFRFLRSNNTINQIQQLQVVPIDISLDDLSKIWSVFFQSPYLLSLAYKVTMVMIDGEETVGRGLPVKETRLRGRELSVRRPIVEKVASRNGQLEPIFSSSKIYIYGKHLNYKIPQVRIANIDVIPCEVSEHKLSLDLQVIDADILRAGVQSLQVIHHLSTDEERFNSGYPIIESNVASFVIRPTIKQISIIEQDEYALEVYLAVLSLKVDTMVGVKQRVILALNEWSSVTKYEPVVYQAEADTRKIETDTVNFTIKNIKPGEYLLRLQIDGAESLLDIDNDENSSTFGWYNSPRVSIGRV